MNLPFGPYEPDRSKYALNASTAIVNCLPIQDGWGPMPSLDVVSEALPSACLGLVLVRTSNGDFAIYAGTQTKLYKLDTTTTPYSWAHVSALDADQVTNGTFAADTDWTKGTNVTIAAGVGTFTASPTGESLSQAQSFTAGTIYKVVFTVSGFSAGGVRPVLSGGTSVNGTTRTADGTYTEYLTAVTGNNTFELEAVGETTLNVDNVTVQALANYAVPSGDRWSFTVYGTRLIATNLTDGVLYLDIDSGTNFADLPGSPPAAKYVWVAGDFLVLGHIASNPRRVRWSAINNSEEWTLGTRGSGLQDLLIGGDVMGGIGSENGAIIISRNAMHVMEKTINVSAAFTIRAVNESRGAISPLSIVSFGSGLFAYLSEDGFFTGVDGKPIGAERVDRTFLADEVDDAYLSEVRGMVDPYNKIVWWQYQKSDATKALLGWNWQLNRWCYSDANVAEIAAMATPGETWDGLDDTFATIDDVDTPYDSRIFAGGRPTLNGFTADNELGVFSGVSQAATLETASTRLGKGYTTPQEVRVVGDCPTYTVKQGTADSHGAIETFGSAVSPHSRHPGLVNFRTSALIHRFRLEIAAGTAWNSMSQLEMLRVSEDGQ